MSDETHIDRDTHGCSEFCCCTCLNALLEDPLYAGLVDT